MRTRGVGTPWWQLLGVACLAVATVALCYLALTRDTTVADPSAAEDPAPASEASESDQEPSAASMATATAADLPEVRDQRRRDFTEGDGLPDGSRVYDSGDHNYGMAVRDGVLGHGRSTAPDALGLVETRLEGDVTSLGFRVLFAEEDSGSAVLAAWQSSVTEASDAARPLPDSGARLVASPGEWRLTILEGGGEQVVAEGSYTVNAEPATFRIVREGREVFVEDPTGAVVVVTDDRAAQLAGPWASWGLLEQDPSQTPAAIEAVWAG